MRQRFDAFRRTSRIEQLPADETYVPEIRAQIGVVREADERDTVVPLVSEIVESLVEPELAGIHHTAWLGA
jgi:hypothetical protein